MKSKITKLENGNKLFQKLEIIKSVTLCDWSSVMLIVHQIKEGLATISNKKWEDPDKERFPNFYPLNLEDISTWSTFSETCIILKFQIDRANLICDVQIYDGDNFNGERKELRFSAKIKFNQSFVYALADCIDYDFKEHLSYLHQEYLKDKKQYWMDLKEDELINI